MDDLKVKSILNIKWFVASLVIIVSSSMNLASYSDLMPNADTRAFGDAVNYVQMSKHTFAAVPNPFGLRLLSPFIVHQIAKLPFVSLASAWLILTFLATTASLFIVFWIIYKYLKAHFFTSTLVILMLSMTYNYTVFNYGDAQLVDPLNNLFYALILLFVLKRQMALFAIAVILGSVNKETTILLAPLYPLAEYVRVGFGPKIVKPLIVAIGCIVAYLLYHLLAQHIVLGAHAYHLLSGVGGSSVWQNVVDSLNARKDKEQLEIFSTFQFVWCIFAYGLYRLYKSGAPGRLVLSLTAYLVAAIYFGTFFATDVPRVYIMLAPLVFGVTAITLEQWNDDASRFGIGIMAVIYIALNLSWITGAASILANFVALILFGIMVLLRQTWLPSRKEL